MAMTSAMTVSEVLSTKRTRTCDLLDELSSSLRVKKLSSRAKLPTRGSVDAAGYDLYRLGPTCVRLSRPNYIYIIYSIYTVYYYKYVISAF